MKNFEAKVESLDPAGCTVKSASFMLQIDDDEKSMTRDRRLILHLGECIYRIDDKGFIIERYVPHEDR